MKTYRVKFKANFLVEAEDEDDAYEQFEEQLDLSQVIIKETRAKID